nr:hypothetical protein [Stenotrophomonas maltophilia]
MEAAATGSPHVLPIGSPGCGKNWWPRAGPGCCGTPRRQRLPVGHDCLGEQSRAGPAPLAPAPLPGSPRFYPAPGSSSRPCLARCRHKPAYHLPPRTIPSSQFGRKLDWRPSQTLFYLPPVAGCDLRRRSADVLFC